MAIAGRPSVPLARLGGPREPFFKRKSQPLMPCQHIPRSSESCESHPVWGAVRNTSVNAATDTVRLTLQIGMLSGTHMRLRLTGRILDAHLRT